MSNGTFTSNEEYPFVGFLAHPDGSYCSGILITPGWVLTAAHCIDGGEAGSACGFSDPPTNTNGPLGTYTMHLFNAPNWGTATPDGQDFSHTLAISGVVHTILGRAVDSCSDEDAALDLALIRLDRRVRLDLVTPKHPINGHCSPQLQINGTLIGYGPTFDLIGESCDPCPGTFSPTFSDMDGDGVGDACDDCPGTPDGMHTENLNTPCLPSVPGDCWLNHPGPVGSVCVPPHRWGGATSTPRCTKGEDTDGDHVGDTCDSCKGVFNPFEGVGTQPNCNLHSEMKVGIVFPFFGDACDPIPCADLDAYTAPACSGPFPCLEPEPWPWVKVAYSTNLLPKTKPGSFQDPNGKVPAATVGTRRCKCGDFVSGNELNVEDCDTVSACPVSAAEYNSAGNWEVIEIQPSSGPDVVPPPIAGPFLANAEYSPLGVVNPDPDPNGASVSGFASRGTFTNWADWHNNEVSLGTPRASVLWSHVTNMTELTDPPAFYNDLANHHEMGAFGATVQIPSGSYVVLEPSLWLEGPLCPACPERIDVPNWTYDPANGQILVQGAAWEVNLTLQVPSTLPTLAATTATWMSVAETSTWVLTDAARLAAISADGSEVLGVFAPIGNSLVDVLHSGTAPPVVNTVVPAARTGFGGVLSAVDNAVFVMGGVANGLPTSDLWRYDITNRTWLQVPIDGVMPHRVLAATFRPVDRSLYVVDEKPMPNGNAKRARVIRIDLATRKTTILANVPRNPLMDHVFISESPNGELLLVGSSSTTNRYYAARLAFTPTGSLVVKKGFDGQGVVVRRPTLTERGVTLPLAASGNAVTNKFIHARDLHPGTFHPVGSCL